MSKYLLWGLWLIVGIASLLLLPTYREHPSVWILGLNVGITGILVALATHPRRSKAVYSYSNWLLRREFWFLLLVSIVLLGINMFPDVQRETRHIVLPAWIGVIALGSAYLMHWSLPCSRKRSGVRAVDKAIKQYKRPMDKVEWAWLPPTVIGGKRYWMVIYQRYEEEEEEKQEPLAFDEDGEVVQDAALMSKIVAGHKLAAHVADRSYARFRISQYESLSRSLDRFPDFFEAISRWKESVDEQTRTELGTVEKALAKTEEAIHLLRETYEREAEWGMQHKNALLKEVHYEEVEKLNEQCHPYKVFYTHSDALKRGCEAAKRLLQRIEQDQDLGEKLSGIEIVLQTLIGLQEPLARAEEYRKTGKMEQCYDFTPWEQAAWKERLRWVDMVDSWIAEGHRGTMLEVRKWEYYEEREEEKGQQETESTTVGTTPSAHRGGGKGR